MTDRDPLVDLAVLVPGKDEEATIGTLLSQRQASLQIREIEYRTLVHPRRDPGCLGEAPQLLETFVRRARQALVVFDHAGCGREAEDVQALESELKRRLSAAGWGDRAEVIVIVPELEAWVWSDSPEVDAVLGWQGAEPSLRDWLKTNGLWEAGASKPSDPKRALEQALRQARVRRSSAIYGALARTVGLERCRDSAFARLRRILQNWFGTGEMGEAT